MGLSYHLTKRMTNWGNIQNFCSDLFWGGRNYINKMVFFVQTIFVDRYNNRRELCVGWLKSSSGVEYGNRKIFSIFVFYGSYRGLNFFLNIRRNSAVVRCNSAELDVIQRPFTFLTKFLSILNNFLSILLN